MKASTRVMIYLVIFAVIDIVIPVPITALILIYVVLERPPWFRNLISEIYGE